MGIIIFWIVLMVAFVVVEFATAGLTSIWFALGALGALISALVAPTAELIWLQLTIFILVSGVAIYFTRPLAKKYHKTNRTATNASRVLEMIGIVKEPVNSLDAHGVVHVDGKLWSARAEGADTIPVGTQVEILRIDGVKLIVRPANETETPEEPSQAADA